MKRAKIILALAAAPQVACSVYEGSGADGGGTVDAASDSEGASVDASFTSASETSVGDSDDPPIDFAEIGIRPPDSLVLDGQTISSGELRIRSVDVSSDGAGWALALDPSADDPIVKQANIGAGEYHSLLLVPGDTKLMRITGEFDAAVPDLPAAQLDMIVVGAVSQPFDLTIYLPSLTSESCTQVTGLGPSVALADNVDVFCADGDVDEIDALVDDATTGMLALGQAPLSTCACGSGGAGGMNFMMTPHGTVSSNGGCGFMCGDGTCVSASSACNSAMDCPSGEDEDPAQCDTPTTCCIVTMGCPSESGSECGDGCCCCPEAQACCPDPNDGCCPSA